MSLLQNHVAVITGSGSGLGRAYAHAFAKEGARVIVSDVTFERAQVVVDEITGSGGSSIAVACDVTDVTQVDALAERAVREWGRLDIFINNAGILRDATLLKSTDADFELILNIHLKGTYYGTRAAGRLMRKLTDEGTQAGGRIVNTTSYAGLKGNFGQTNYSAAKAGIWGMSQTAAQELAKYGITVNCVAPLAKTPLTENTPVIPDDFKPEDTAPVMVFLCSDLGKDVTGRTFGIHGKHLFEYTMEMTPGVDRGSEAWTPSDVAQHFSAITETAASKARRTAETVSRSGVEDEASKVFPLPSDGSGQSDTSLDATADSQPSHSIATTKLPRLSSTGMNLQAIGSNFDGKESFVRPDDVAAYAAATNDANPAYQRSGSDRLVPPLFVVKPIRDVLFEAILDGELHMDVLRMVHGEQHFTFHQPLKPWDLISPRSSIAAIEERSSGDTCVIRCRAMVDGYAAVESVSTMFVRGKKSGEKSQDRATSEAQPGAAPEATATFETTRDQAERYAAISGDRNPIHLDPEVAKQAGLPGVILHGLCTMAFACQALVHTFADDDPTRVYELGCRFSGIVQPGDTLTVEMWTVDAAASRLHHLGYQVRNQAGSLVISNGTASLLRSGRVV